MSFTAIPTNIDEAVADLRTRCAGPVLTADDPAPGVAAPEGASYDAARAAWNVLVQHRPAVIVIPESVADVCEAVRFGRATGLRVAVQATGHGAGRPPDDALLIVTNRLTDVQVDAEARTATIAAGAKWGAVLAATQAHGLAPLLGSSPEVGAIGYTLGGGLGWLARRYGLASDSVRAVELVTPDGICVRTSADQQPELFWALKGGGGGTLGVVTAMEIDLYPVTTVYGGNLLYPVDAAREVMARWRDWVASAPDELTSSVVFMNFPPLDDVPEPLRGRSFVIVRGCWCGDLEEGRRLVDQWREWRAPVIDLFGAMPFGEVATISNDPVDALPAMLTTEWFDEIPDQVVTILERATLPTSAQPPQLLFSEVRHAGGAIRANAPAAVNDRGRSGEFLLEMVGVPFDHHAALTLEAHLRSTRRALAPYATGATYLNFTEGREKQERSESAFSSEHLARIRQVKGAIDRDNRFCHGLGINPSA